MKLFKFGAMALAGVLVVGTTAWSQQNQNQNRNQNRNQNQTQERDQTRDQPQIQYRGADRDFVMHAVKSGMLEVRLGKLAERRASNDQVRSFAQRMVRDHTAANNKLLAIIRNEKSTAGAGTTERSGTSDRSGTTQKRDEVARLSKLSGTEFDRAYMDLMVKDHEKAVKLFQTEAKSGRDQALKQFAQDTLPTLEEHLKLANQIHGSLQK